jgi:GT2 family glycosyltransferase
VTDGRGGAVLVLHTTLPAVDAPDPRDRHVARRVLDLASRLPGRLTLLATEPRLSTATAADYEVAGVRTVEGPVVFDEPVAAAIATDLDLAERVAQYRPDVPLVIDLATVRSARYAATRDGIDEPELAGFDDVLGRLRGRDAEVLRRVALVVCADDTVAAAVATLVPGANACTIGPPVPVDARRVSLRSRHGAVFAGHFATVPGLPDEIALDRVLDQWPLDAPLDAGGLDVAPTRRLVRRRLGRAVGPCHVWHLVDDARVAIVANAQGALSAELRGGAVPVIALDDHRDVPSAVRELMTDDDAWHRAVHAQRARAVSQHDPMSVGERYAVALRDLGVDIGEHDEHRAAAVPTYRPPSVPGSMAAVSDAHEAMRREAMPDSFLPWQHALYTNLDMTPDGAYRRWHAVRRDVDARRDVYAARADALVNKPLVSIVMPVHDTEPSMLRAAIESVRAQIYDRWELCVTDDGSRRRDTRDELRLQAANDDRIRVTRHDTAQGIAAASNAATGLARGTYVAFLDHDDVLAPDALLHVMRLLDADPALDVVYTDEDKLDEQGRRVEPFCKPDWSPDLLLSCNYITHLLVVRRSLLDDVGGLRTGFDGAQDYDLLLRLTERTDRIGHVAVPLYSWRKSAGSTAADIGAKPAAHAASRAAVEAALGRRGLDARVEPGIDPTWHRVRYRIPRRPRVTVIIPTRDRVDLLAPCIDAVRATVRHEPLELLVLDNESTDAETLAYLDAFEGRVVRYPHRFNYARQMNLAVLEASGEVLLLLNNDVRPRNDEWFDALLEHALRPEVGAAGARLFWPDGRPQHEGIVLNAGGVALNLDSGPWAVLGANIRDTAAVTGACLMTRKAVWQDVGGMDERLRVAYNDVDLCLRIGERGLRIVYTPVAELTHAESSSRGSLHPEVDEAFYRERWGPPRTAADPFFTTCIELLVPFSPRL